MIITKLKNIKQVEDFLAAVKAAKGDVWLISQLGDRYNLKSALTQYIALGALLDNHGEDLELFCNNKSDEPLFLNFFYNNPETA